MHELEKQYWEKYEEDPSEKRGLMEDPDAYLERLRFALEHGLKIDETPTERPELLA